MLYLDLNCPFLHVLIHLSNFISSNTGPAIYSHQEDVLMFTASNTLEFVSENMVLVSQHSPLHQNKHILL